MEMTPDVIRHVHGNHICEVDDAERQLYLDYHAEYASCRGRDGGVAGIKRDEERRGRTINGSEVRIFISHIPTKEGYGIVKSLSLSLTALRTNSLCSPPTSYMSRHLARHDVTRNAHSVHNPSSIIDPA